MFHVKQFQFLLFHNDGKLLVNQQLQGYLMFHFHIYRAISSADQMIPNAALSPHEVMGLSLLLFQLITFLCPVALTNLYDQEIRANQSLGFSYSMGDDLQFEKHPLRLKYYVF